MAQYNPQAQPQQPGQGGGGGRGGGRGGYQGRGPQGGRNPNPGGRGPQGGRGGMQGGRGNMQQQPQGRGGGGPVSAWQPTPASSLQQAAYGRQPQQQQGGGYHPQHQQHPGHPNQHHQQGGPGGPHYAANMHYNPYATQQANAYRGAQGGPGGGWQATGYPPQGGVYYPPTQQQQQQQQPGSLVATPASTTPAAGAAGGATPTPVVAKPREKKPLVITDKDGNVLDFRSEKAKTGPSSLKAAVAATTEKPATKTEAAAAPAVKSADAGSKLREAALAAISGKDAKADAAKKPAEKAAPATAAPAAKAAEPAKTKVPVPAKEEKKVPEPKAPAKTLAAVAAAPAPAKPMSAAAAVKSGSSLAAATKKPSLAAIAAAPAPVAPKSVGGALRPGGNKSRVASGDVKGARRVYTKAFLMKLKQTESCMKKPESLPDMTIEKGPVKQQGGGGGGGGGSRGNNRGGGGGGGGNWDRGQNQPNRRNSQNNNNNSNDWQRGQAPPKNKGNNKNGRRGSQNNEPPLLEGPVAPLVISENRWKPSKDNNPLAVAEKTVKGILNKMTKEKFDRLATQMCDIQILSYDMLTMIIHNVYEKAIDEPSFGDMYADLCVRLSKGAAQANNDFVKVIESDEEPPTEGDAAPASQQSASSSHVVYRWSNDVSTTDSEVIGPFKSADECIDAALTESGSPEPRGEAKLELVKLVIKKGIFIKILKKKDEDAFFCVYFPVSEAEECGQQLSEIFLSEVECVSSAKKKNSFKRSLLNKCEDEFKKQDIYVDWKEEKKEYEESKDSLTDADRREKESDLNFRRIKIKKQMLGNIKFIGQLYKKGLLKEKIMRFCIGSLLKLEELTELKSKNPEYKDTGDMDMDEEDHEAICSMFTTIGLTIDKPSGADFMKVCFTKIHQLSMDKKNLPARSRFMYKDLLELRENRWVPRRDEGKAKTLEEIRKDVEKEEQRQAKISQQNYQNDRGNNNNRRGSQQQGGYDNRRGGSNFGGRGSSGGSNNNRNRRESVKPQEVTDDDGFTTIVTRGAPVVKGSSTVGSSGEKKQAAPKSGGASSSSAPAPLSQDKLERRIKSMRSEYIQDPTNTSELLLSMDELSGTEDAGLTLVTKSADALLDCKESERKAISDVIRILYENKKLTSAEIKNGLADFIEFIDSMVIDCPKLFEYVGDLLAVLFQVKAVDVSWYVDTVEKTKADPDTSAPEKLTRATIGSVRKSGGASAAQAIFGSSGSQMNGLVGADKWSAISNDLLG